VLPCGDKWTQPGARAPDQPLEHLVALEAEWFSPGAGRGLQESPQSNALMGQSPK
jgi:hypothetical protein